MTISVSSLLPFCLLLGKGKQWIKGVKHGKKCSMSMGTAP